MSDASGSGHLLRPVAIWRGAFTGLVAIVPIVVVLEVVDRNWHDLDRSNWLVLPFLLILFVYMLAGFGAAQWAPDAPLTNGSLAALGTFFGWLLIRVVGPTLLGRDVDIGWRGVFTNALFAAAFGMAGAAAAMRAARRTPS